jgi:hypothetical protein
MLSTSWNSSVYGELRHRHRRIKHPPSSRSPLDDLLSCVLLSRIIAANTDLDLIGALGPLRQLPCNLGKGCREGEDLFYRQTGSNSLQPRWDQCSHVTSYLDHISEKNNEVGEIALLEFVVWLPHCVSIRAFYTNRCRRGCLTMLLHLRVSRRTTPPSSRRYTIVIEFYPTCIGIILWQPSSKLVYE